MSKLLTTQEAKAFEHNPRTITPEGAGTLSASLQEFGDISGLTFNRQSGQWVGGNQRAELMELNGTDFKIQVFEEYKTPDEFGTVALGFVEWKGQKYFVRVVDWGPKTERRANIAANKLGGDWDFKILREQWDFVAELQPLGFQDWEVGYFPPQVGEPSAAPTERVGVEHQMDKYDNYGAGETKKFEFILSREEYAIVSQILPFAKKHFGVETNTEVFLKLLEAFDADHEKS